MTALPKFVKSKDGAVATFGKVSWDIFPFILNMKCRNVIWRLEKRFVACVRMLSHPEIFCAITKGLWIFNYYITCFMVNNTLNCFDVFFKTLTVKDALII